MESSYSRAVRDTRYTITYRVYAARRGHCRSLLSLQRNRTITSINFMNGPLARQSLTPLVCASDARWKEREEKRREKTEEKDEREVYRTRCHPSFCAVVVHGSARSLQPLPRHNALSSPTRTVSRYAIVEDPCSPPPPPAHFSLWRRKSRRRNVPRNLHESLTTGTRAYKCTVAFRPPLLDRRSCFHKINFDCRTWRDTRRINDKWKEIARRFRGLRRKKTERM